MKIEVGHTYVARNNTFEYPIYFRIISEAFAETRYGRRDYYLGAQVFDGNCFDIHSDALEWFNQEGVSLGDRYRLTRKSKKRDSSEPMCRRGDVDGFDDPNLSARHEIEKKKEQEALRIAERKKLIEYERQCQKDIEENGGTLFFDVLVDGELKTWASEFRMTADRYHELAKETPISLIGKQFNVPHYEAVVAHRLVRADDEVVASYGQPTPDA